MIDSIRLQHFRSYTDESFEFGDSVNIIVGPNTSGKTNLLEALLVSCMGSSYRARDSDLLRESAPWARIDVQNDNNPRTVKLMVQDNGLVKKEFIINNQTLTRLHLSKTVPATLFEPNHLLLLHGSPERRREYLDEILYKLVSGYSKTKRDYQRTLAQRNSLLKKGQKNQLFAWDIRLSEIGAQIATHRASLVARINERINELYQDLSQATSIDIRVSYINSCGGDIGQYGSNLLRALEKRHDADLERGYTTVGPHREDLQIAFNSRTLSEVASRGETRTTLLALKIMEIILLEEATGSKPILLLDDVFSELDGARRKALTKAIKGYQTFITTTDADIVVQHFLDDCTVIPLG